jgi:hypothetical protein
VNADLEGYLVQATKAVLEMLIERFGYGALGEWRLESCCALVGSAPCCLRFIFSGSRAVYSVSKSASPTLALGCVDIIDNGTIRLPHVCVTDALYCSKTLT